MTGRSARGQKAFAGRAARRARTTVRWREIELPVPKGERGRLGGTPIRLTAVHVREEDPPADAEAIEWLLLTTLPVTGIDGAGRVLRLYGLRWRIEDWHRILKSGCDVERISHSRAERLKRAVTLNAVIAWRLATLTLMGRDTPELAADTLLASSEIATPLDFARARGLGLACQGDGGGVPELSAVSLGEAVLLVARLGGYLNRKHDTAPGHQVIWEGYMRMSTGAQTMERIVRNGPDSAIHKLNVLSKND